jgi:hypothetical protein
MKIKLKMKEAAILLAVLIGAMDRAQDGKVKEDLLRLHGRIGKRVLRDLDPKEKKPASKKTNGVSTST